MDGLRGIAMLLVFMGHFGEVWNQLVHPNGSAGFFLRLLDADATFGSSFFMLLSAFFAYGARMRGSKSFRDFLVGRVWRLYPLYLIMTFVYVAGCIAIPHLSKLPHDPQHAVIFIAQNLLFLPGILPITPLMDVAWTLSFVVFFYFVEAGLAHAFRFANVSRLFRITFLLAAGVLWLSACNSLGWWPCRTSMFWVGMALWEAVDALSGAWRYWAVRLTGPAVVITLVGIWVRTDLALYQPHTGILPLAIWRTFITAMTLSAFVWVAYFGPEWWKQFLSAREFRRLGAASYSFYLTHGFAVKAFRYAIIPWLGAAAGGPLVFWTCQLDGLALSIVIARAAYLLVENPLSKFTDTVAAPSRQLRRAETAS